jgi:polar amino acid transport system substrate-binding protein
MDMTRYLSTWVLLLIVLSLGGCGEKESSITSLKMLEGGKTFAVPTGTAADQFVKKKFPDAAIEYYNSVMDCALAVKDGKADAAVYDLPVLKNIAAKNEGLLVLPELLFDDQYGFAVRLQDTLLKKAMDDVLDELKSNGTYDEMSKRWFPEKGNPGPMPELKFDDANGVLKFGTAAISEPMSYYDGQKNVVGFDIEFASYIAKKLGKRLEVVDMEFGAMIPALIAGKVDMIGAGLSITEERAKSVLFSRSYYKSGLAAMVEDGSKNISKDSSKEDPEESGTKMKSIGEIKTKRIGVLLGSIHDSYATRTFPKATILQYQNISDMLFGLNSNKVDVAFMDHTGLKDVFNKNPDLGVLAENVFAVDIAAGLNSERNQIQRPL